MFIVFFCFWVILNGRVTLEITLFGLVISAALYLFMCAFMGFSIKKDLQFIKLVPRLIVYLLVLIKEIVIATAVMLGYIISGKNHKPAIVHFSSPLKNRMLMTILANSITLTPGTLTVELTGNDYYIHCYDKSMGEGLESSVFVRQLKNMEGGL